MLDKWTGAAVRPLLHVVARKLDQVGIQANHVTVAGFFIGISALPALAAGLYGLALVLIIINRIADGLDGALARVHETTDVGGFLDIVLDFIFYASVILGFALASPEKNALWACLLLFAFMGTASSFLAFASIAAKRGIDNPVYQNKSLYYLGGLAEGTETIIFFVSMCLFPVFFPAIAIVFSIICFITTFTRIVAGVHTFKSNAARFEF